MATMVHVTQPTDAGVARCVQVLAAWQLGAGHDVVVVCPPDGPLAAELAQDGVRVEPWAARRQPGRQAADEVRRLHRLLRSAEPDLVHLHSSKAGLAGRLALRGRLPTVFQPHAWSFEASRGPVGRAARVWERTATRWTDLLVCVSDAERRTGKAVGALPPQVLVAPNGVDLQALQPSSAADRSRAREELGLPDGPLAVCVGRLARQKGQDLLLAAWPAVRAAVPGARLVLVGDGPDRGALERAAPQGVRLVGSSDDVGCWYAAADVVVVPSRWEGMALVPLEAMARARSVVACDVSGVRESVPSGAGVIVPPEDPAALARALTARLSGAVDADAEGRVGRAHVERDHDAQTACALITAACTDLLGHHQAGQR